MSALDIFGGVGKGIMMGQNHIAQQKAHDANLRRTEQQMKFDSARLGLLNEEAQHAKAERDRVTRLSTLQNQLMQDYPDANEYQRQTMLVDTGVKENLFRGDELTQAEAMRKQMRETFGVEAYDAALAGDIKPLQMILGERGSAVDFTPDRKGLVIYGQGDQRQEIPISGLLQLDAMGLVRAREAARRQQQLENDKLISETNKNNRMYGAIINPDGTTSTVSRSGGVRSTGGSRSGGAGGASGNFDAIESQKDYAAAFGDDEVFDRAKGHALLQQLYDNNTELGKTPSGQSRMLLASRAMAEGNAEVRPVIAEDGTLQLRAMVGPDDYVLESNVPEDRMVSLMKQYAPADPEKPGMIRRILGSTPEAPKSVDEQFIGQMYLEALREGAVNSPADFEDAWRLVNEPEALESAMQDVRSGDADVGLQRMVRAALTLQRGLNHLQAQNPVQSSATPASPGRDDRSEFSRAFNDGDAESVADDPLAAALDLQETPPLGDAIVDAGTRAVSGIAEGIGSVARTAIGVNPSQRERSLEAELDRYKRARTSGNRNLINHHARELYRLAKGDDALTEYVMRAIGQESPKPIRQATQ